MVFIISNWSSVCMLLYTSLVGLAVEMGGLKKLNLDIHVYINDINIMTLLHGSGTM